MKDIETQCSVCGRKEGRNKEFGYPIGYYEFDTLIGGRKTTYQICTKCNRCFIKENSHNNGFQTDGRRTVYIPPSVAKSSTPA